MGAGFQYVLFTAIFQHPGRCLVHQKAFYFFASLKKNNKPEWAVYKRTQSCYSRASSHLLIPRGEEPREEREPQATAVCPPQQMVEREILRARHRWEQVVSLMQSLLDVTSLWGAVPSVQGVLLKCPCMASWRLLDFPCSLIQNMANLLARCLIASLGAFPLDHLHTLKPESVTTL